MWLKPDRYRTCFVSCLKATGIDRIETNQGQGASHVLPLTQPPYPSLPPSGGSTRLPSTLLRDSERSRTATALRDSKGRFALTLSLTTSHGAFPSSYANRAYALNLSELGPANAAEVRVLSRKGEGRDSNQGRAPTHFVEKTACDRSSERRRLFLPRNQDHAGGVEAVFHQVEIPVNRFQDKSGAVEQVQHLGEGE
jgi:hypothetical protein